MSKHKARVLVLGLGANGLGVVRSLYSFPEYKVIGVHFGRGDVGRFTRLVRKIACTEPIADAKALSEKIPEWCPGPVPTVIIPSRDIEVNLLSELADELPAHFLFYRNSNAAVRALSDKNLVQKTALQAGLEIPKTLFLTDPEDAALVGLRYPLLLKPLRSNVSQTPFKNIMVHNESELHRVLQKEELVNHVVLQEFIPGGDDHVYHCNLLIDRRSRTIGVVELQKIRQYVRLRGMTSYGSTLLTRELLPMCERLAAVVGYKGLMNIEFKKDDENDRWVFIETNLRLPIFNSVFARAGVNLAHLYVQSLLEEPPSSPAFASRTATWMHEENDLANILMRRVDAKFSQWFWQFIRSDSYAYWFSYDPLPSIYLWCWMIYRQCKRLFSIGHA